MAHTVLSRVDQPKVSAVFGIGTFVAVFFLAWLALIFVLAARGAFVAAPGAPPLALLTQVPYGCTCPRPVQKK